MIINGERALAYVVSIDEVKDIPNYDRVELARTNGWWVVVSKKDNLKVGDKCVYFEIDSLVPSDDERFKFLEKRKYKIKTQKMCGVTSQGLLMPLILFPEIIDMPINTDVTEILRVKYNVQEDNDRKKKTDPESKYKSMASRHKKIFSLRIVRRIMRHNIGKKIMFFLFGKKKDKPLDFPSFIKKTDEERVENQPWRAGDGKQYLLTEKLDGTSCTYALKRTKPNSKKYEFYVCSRNRRLLDNDTSNIYWQLAQKYDIKNRLTEYLDTHFDMQWVCIQGEGVGSVQGNPYRLQENDLYIFNFITSTSGRFNSIKGQNIITTWGMKWVPIIGYDYTENSMELLKQKADGKSLINENVDREGIVYRSIDGKDSFKNVSRKYLLKH